MIVQVAHGKDRPGNGKRDEDQRERATTPPRATALDRLENGIPHGQRV